MEDNKITLDNIDYIRDKIDGSWENAVKSTILNFLEVSYEEQLESGKINVEVLETITTNIVEREEFNNYIDSFIQEEMEIYLQKNNIIENEEELEK